MTKTQFTISETSRITGKSRTTLRTYLKKGTLSYVEGHGDQRLIDGSELTRVFGNDLDFELATPATKRSPQNQKSTLAKVDQSGQAELQLVKEQLAREIAERNRERERLEGELGELHGILKRTHEEHSKALLLITDQSEKTTKREGDWEQFQRTIEKRLANQEERFEQEQEKLKNLAKQKISEWRGKYEEEQAKPWFQKLFEKSRVG